MRIWALTGITGVALGWPMLPQDVVMPGWLWGIITAAFAVCMAVIGGLLMIGYRDVRAAIPDKVEMERRWAEERHDMRAHIREVILPRLTKEIDDLEKRIDRLEASQGRTG